MRMGEKITWGFISILAAGAIALLYLLNIWLGAIFTLFTVLTVWLVWIRKKKRVDAALAAVAEDTGLQVQSHPLVYNSLHGTYEDVPVQLDFVSDWSMGVGFSAAWLTGQANLVLADMRNFTRIVAELPFEIEDCLVDDKWPVITARGKYLTLMRPRACYDEEEIISYIQLLVARAKEVADEGWKAPVRKQRKRKSRLDFWQHLPWYAKMWLAFGAVAIVFGVLVALDSM